MVARAQLTALDHNANCGRKQATVQSGPRTGQARYKVSFPKAQKQWVAKPIKEKKSYEHVMVLMDTGTLLLMPVKQVKLTLNLKHAISPKTSQGLHLQANKNLSVNTGPDLTDKISKFWQHKCRFCLLLLRTIQQ